MHIELKRTGRPMLKHAIESRLDRAADRLPRTVLSLDDRLHAVRQFGDFTQAYSTATQSGLRYFGDRDGYIAYGIKQGSVVALADPVVAETRRADFIRAFVEAAGRPCFAEVSRSTADILADLGYRIATIGFDTALDLPGYDYSGPKKEKHRYSERWVEKRGFRIVEAHGTGKDEAALELSRRWRGGRIVKKREMAFMNRPFPVEIDPLMRRFQLVSPDGAIDSLLYFDPIFRGGATIGYAAVFKRRSPDTTSNAELALMKRAVDTFKAEGREVVTLSLAPFAGIEPSGYRESPAFRLLLDSLFKSKLVNRKVFNIQGHAEQRRRAYGRVIPRYFAWGRGSPFLHMLATLRLCKAF
jgi:lysylphosphatidylglycerol synthetase-like protein (DUF2156 family)